ncbi:MAG TPA: hypothetical protein VFQ35_10600 [Polyangiaceae bacterium]|nr:hypothetical protein [Polyangiaceae bacterium]
MKRRRSRVKTEHNGAKNGGGYYGTRAEGAARCSGCVEHRK